MCQTQFFRIISQNNEHVENVCNDSNNLFLFTCRKRMLENGS